MMRRLCVAACISAAALLAGCGLKGDLVTPGPMWGERDRAVVERDLPSADSPASERIVFTRDDVDIFSDPEAEEDPFADPDDPDAPSAPRDLPLGPESDR